jgi:hypothetical protein
MLKYLNQSKFIEEFEIILASSATALQYLYYTDGLARCPARDLPEPRFQKTEDRRRKEEGRA